MKLSGIVLVFVSVISAVTLSEAQQQARVPRGVETLRKQASSKAEFTLDHSMLVLALKLDPGNEGLRRVIAGVNGIAVHSYKFPGVWAYDLAVLSSVKEEYRAAGWKQMVNKEKEGDQGVTLLWLRLENNAISDVAVLLAKPNEVDFIVVSGSISPVDLSHLGGHFGIPKIEGGVMVPNTARRP
ncbi:MAG: DUF4252 domain-containing protein [Terriglobales bacterium]|jgi:hypothetical protein